HAAARRTVVHELASAGDERWLLPRVHDGTEADDRRLEERAAEPRGEIDHCLHRRGEALERVGVDGHRHARAIVAVESDVGFSQTDDWECGAEHKPGNGHDRGENAPHTQPPEVIGHEYAGSPRRYGGLGSRTAVRCRPA